MKKLTIFFGLILLVNSCIFIHMDDSIDLGGNYRYIQDSPQSIIYHESSEYEGDGMEVIPPAVLNYDFNDRYIIAKSKDWESEVIKYWLIDKKQDCFEIEPLDSLTFYNLLLKNRIELKLN
ncbi:MAG: hypothetical protein JEZ14_23780 [Marinilabiliaceae bacterium]|nr:hypothetical protein [Marinilabiliaceae bacterium]